MTFIDLSHPLQETMPVFPGATPPRFSRTRTVAGEGYQESLLTLASHTGTHMDAPAHMLAQGKTLTDFPIDRFMGNGLIYSRPGQPESPIEPADLQPLSDAIAAVDFLLLHTGWSRHWGTPRYFSDYPALTPEAARWLCRFSLKGIGIDAISIDPAGSADYPVHHILMEREILIIENLVRLDQAAAAPFLFIALPLPFPHADGSPVRAVAVMGIG